MPPEEEEMFDDDVLLEDVRILPFRTAGLLCSPVVSSITPCISAILNGAMDLHERRNRLSVVASDGVSGGKLLLDVVVLPLYEALEAVSTPRWLEVDVDFLHAEEALGQS